MSTHAATMVLQKNLPLGLTDYARHDPDLIRKAQDLESDRSSLTSVRRRLIDKHSMTPEQTRAAETDCLRFVLLTDVADGPISPTKRGDDYWHAFLMFIRDYRMWCEKHFGQFLDHQPVIHLSGSVPKRRGKEARSRSLRSVLRRRSECQCAVLLSVLLLSMKWRIG